MNGSSQVTVALRPGEERLRESNTQTSLHKAITAVFELSKLSYSSGFVNVLSCHSFVVGCVTAFLEPLLFSWRAVPVKDGICVNNVTIPTPITAKTYFPPFLFCFSVASHHVSCKGELPPAAI